MPALAGPRKVYHAQLSGPTVALDKPVTEVAVLTLKTPSPDNRAALVDILSKLAEATKNLVAFGLTREDENKYIVIYGWESVEVRKSRAFLGGRDALMLLINNGIGSQTGRFETRISRNTPEVTLAC